MKVSVLIAFEPYQLEAMDAVRGKVTRTAWVRAAVEQALASEMAVVASDLDDPADADERSLPDPFCVGGGPAFPSTVNQTGVGQVSYCGLSVREWFAGQALPMVAMLCASDTPIAGETSVQMFARKTYEVADAMLAAGGQP